MENLLPVKCYIIFLNFKNLDVRLVGNIGKPPLKEKNKKKNNFYYRGFIISNIL